jgi:hypothetical protein
MKLTAAARAEPARFTADDHPSKLPEADDPRGVEPAWLHEHVPTTLQEAKPKAGTARGDFQFARANGHRGNGPHGRTIPEVQIAIVPDSRSLLFKSLHLAAALTRRV